MLPPQGPERPRWDPERPPARRLPQMLLPLGCPTLAVLLGAVQHQGHCLAC